MRLLEVAQGLEVGHHVSERGAGDVELRPGELATPHRTAGRDVFANHGMQYGARALVEVFHVTPAQMVGPPPGRFNRDPNPQPPATSGPSRRGRPGRVPGRVFLAPRFPA